MTAMTREYTTPIVLSATGTADATLRGEKTVTRRLARDGVSCRWKPGRYARIYRLTPRAKGKPIGEVFVVSVRGERLSDVTDDEVKREGFPHLDAHCFSMLFRDLHGLGPADDPRVWRVEYTLVDVVNAAGEPGSVFDPSRWVVCARLSDPRRLKIEGQIEKRCTGCGEPIAVSPSGQAWLAYGPPYCGECYEKARQPETTGIWAPGAKEERAIHRGGGN